MKTRTLSTWAAIVTALAGFGAAQAQTTMPAKNPASSASGEMAVPNQDKGMRQGPTVNDRGSVKADGVASRASAPMGERSTASQGSKPMRPKTSEKSRAEVKAEAAAANKANDPVDGERSTKNQDKGGGAGVRP